MEVTDFELIERCRKGESKWFAELYERHVKHIYNLAYRMVGPGREIEELTQEAFLQAFKNLDRFRGEAAFSTWLHRIACNVCLRFLKGRKRRAETVNYDDLADVELPGYEMPDPLEAVERRDTERRLESALKHLQPSQRTVLMLGPIEGHSYEEMSGILGLSVQVIKGRLHRARVNIRKLCNRGELPQPVRPSRAIKRPTVSAGVFGAQPAQAFSASSK